jgi:hypothetical protein
MLKENGPLKEIIQHVIRYRTFFSYRALRISRNTTALPGFDENEYVLTHDKRIDICRVC